MARISKAEQKRQRVRAALDRAVEGTTQKALADFLKISSPAISDWYIHGRVPATRAPKIEQFTGGAVDRRDLCPDVEW
jgi:DNA-binding transcriptional regulator YdaS (Cro superfamily)